MTRTDMTGKEPHEVWSVNLTSLQFYLALIARLAGVVVVAWAAVAFAGGSIFEKQLETFHQEVIPKIESKMDSKIQDHYNAARTDQAESRQIETDRLARIEQQLSDQQSRLERMEGLLWELVQDGRP